LFAACEKSLASVGKQGTLEYKHEACAPDIDAGNGYRPSNGHAAVEDRKAPDGSLSDGGTVPGLHRSAVRDGLTSGNAPRRHAAGGTRVKECAALPT
jgi:hypothetical protein